FECGGADSSWHDGVANYISGGSVDSESASQSHALIQCGADLVAGAVCFQLRHVQAEFSGDRQRGRLVGLSATAEQAPVEVQGFGAVGVLHANGNRDLCRLN